MRRLALLVVLGATVSPVVPATAVTLTQHPNQSYPAEVVSGYYIGSVKLPDELLHSTVVGPTGTFVYPVPNWPIALAAGPDGALWIDNAAGSIDRLDQSGAYVKHDLGGRNPVDFTWGPGGNLWITTSWLTIERMNLAGEMTGEWPLPFMAHGIVSAGGALWFGDGLYIGSITTDGAISLYPIPNPSGKPEGDYGVPAATYIAQGPDGALWFCDPGDDSIGRLVDGQVSEYAIPPLTVALQAYPGVSDAVPNHIMVSGAEVLVEESDAKALLSVNPNGVAARAASHGGCHRHCSRHHRRHRR